jgi:hypothetical protein
MPDIEQSDLNPQQPLFHGLAADLEAAKLTNLTTEQKVPYAIWKDVGKMVKK